MIDDEKHKGDDQDDDFLGDDSLADADDDEQDDDYLGTYAGDDRSGY